MHPVCDDLSLEAPCRGMEKHRGVFTGWDIQAALDVLQAGFQASVRSQASCVKFLVSQRT